ncbi:MAG: bis(5'-nucleosyl)-tetraphosphatase (symmetrical) YqeK [Peptococcaceae bacterium]|nr:bis(5'-nucleosyl)-tetraphosphatase (symmetrical) YqeK [Peptococcaceae bacterium]
MHILAKTIAQHLSPPRFKHSMGVAQTAALLAQRYGVEPEQAWLAGLVHDYAREMQAVDLLAWAQKLGELDHITQLHKELLHAPVGAHLIKLELGIQDLEIVQAVATHTLGDVNMSTLAKIIFLADMIEPGRKYPGVERLREKGQQSLNEAVLGSIDHTIKYLVAEGKPIHPRTIAARNFLIMGGE